MEPITIVGIMAVFYAIHHIGKEKGRKALLNEIRNDDRKRYNLLKLCYRIYNV